MSAKRKSGKSPKSVVLTLGALLYADKSVLRTPESEWVALLRGVAAGDTGSFGTLYMWTHGIVFSLIIRILRNRARAEDATVEVFHDIWRRAGDYHADSGTVVGWIMNLARSHALQQRSAQRRARATRASRDSELEGT